MTDEPTAEPTNRRTRRFIQERYIFNTTRHLYMCYIRTHRADDRSKRSVERCAKNPHQLFLGDNCRKRRCRYTAVYSSLFQAICSFCHFNARLCQNSFIVTIKYISEKKPIYVYEKSNLFRSLRIILNVRPIRIITQVTGQRGGEERGEEIKARRRLKNRPIIETSSL